MMRLLDSLTMYKVITFGLLGLVLVSLGLGVAGSIAFGPVALLVSLLTLCLVCGVSNYLFAVLFNVTPNLESSLITAVILYFIVEPSTEPRTLLVNAGVALAAIASKYLIAYRGRHIFNPAAFGVAVVALAGGFVGLWWIATPYMLPFVVLIGALIVLKQREVTMVSAFIISALVVMVLVASLRGNAGLQTLITAFASWPLLFLGTIMLTEPYTMPTRQSFKLYFTIIVGVLFASQLHLGPLTTTPQNALLIGNLLAFAVNAKGQAKLKLLEKRQLTPRTWDLVFEPLQPLRFQAGQYMDITLPIAMRQLDIRGNRRTFSIASAPSEPNVHIGIRTYEKGSAFKKTLLALEPGSLVTAGHVGGEFTLPKDKTVPLLFIASGVGITPFRSMLVELSQEDTKRPVILLYQTRTPQDIMYSDVLAAARMRGVEIINISDLPSEDSFKQLVPDHGSRQTYISGSPQTVQQYQALLLRLNVASKQIKTDRFTGY